MSLEKEDLELVQKQADAKGYIESSWLLNSLIEAIDDREKKAPRASAKADGIPPFKC